MNDTERLIRYWADENITQQRRPYFDYATRKMFDQYLPEVKEKIVLDVGSGLGMSMDYFVKRGSRVKGIDITPQSVRAARESGLDVIESDARNIPFENSRFDIVYSIGVIEHFKETQIALEEQVRVCKSGGIVIAVVPNLITPYSIGMILFELLSGRARHGMLTTYGKPFSRTSFRNMFKKVGCRDIVVKPYYGSAFLRLLFNKVYKGVTDVIEKSFFSRTFGLVLWGMGYKV